MEATKTRLKRGRLTGDNERTFRLLVGVGLAIAVVAYTLLYATRVFTLSNGWAYTYYTLVQQGQVPYRDFYYYLPPGNLVINWLLYSVSGDMLVIATWLRIVERVFLAELLYVMTAKYINPLLGGMASFLAVILSVSSVTDLGGDYNQTIYITLALLLFFFLKYEQNIDKPLRKKAGWLMAVGACGGLMLTIKQTIVLTSFVMFLLLMSFLFLIGKEKNYFAACLFVLIGAVFVLALFAVYLIGNGALQPFLEQVFLDTSAKGGTKSILTGHIVQFFVKNIGKLVAIVLGLLAYCLTKGETRLSAKLSSKTRYGLLAGGVALSAALFAEVFAGKLWDGVEETFTCGFIIPLALALFLVIWPKTNKKTYALFVFGAACLVTVALLLNIGDMTMKFYQKTVLFTALRTLVGCGFLMVLIWTVYHLIVGFSHKKAFALDKLTFACAALAGGSASIITNGMDDISVGCSYLVIPALTVIVFKNIPFDSRRMRTCTKVFAAVLICVLSVGVSQKLVKPYSWWGYTAEPFWTKTETSSIPALKGYKLSKNDIELYDELTKVIEDNTDENSVIFGFPYVKCYNVFLDNFNTDTFVPVPFYDVCSDKYARADAAVLQQHEPDIVIWLDISNCMETHERLFRGGEELGQRDFQKWFDGVRETDYTCVGQVNNLYVYKLTKNGQPVNSVHIQRPSRTNKTAEYTLNKIAGLTGTGTEEDPFLITSKEDLEYFRDLVNEGKTKFKEVYFRQTADIDLKDVKSWVPIGEFGKGHYFNGIYDGDGYEIRNMVIDDPKENVKENVGLFGVLNGTVQNLNLVNCTVVGDCVSGITSHGKANIYNCYVSGTIKGNGRVSGVADNANAQIVNCVTEVELRGTGIPAGISGYCSNTVYHCFSKQGNDVCVDDGLPIPKNAVAELNDYDPEVDDLELDPTTLNTWEMTKDGLRVSHEKRAS